MKCQSCWYKLLPFVPRWSYIAGSSENLYLALFPVFNHFPAIFSSGPNVSFAGMPDLPIHPARSHDSKNPIPDMKSSKGLVLINKRGQADEVKTWEVKYMVCSINVSAGSPVFEELLFLKSCFPR